VSDCANRACLTHDDQMAENLSRHWDDAYELGDSTRSWYQHEAVMSLAALDAANIDASQGVIDVGGGASTLVDGLLRRGHRDVTVLDLSDAGMLVAKKRLGGSADTVEWITADVTRWHPRRTYAVWHDRAVFHFLTDNADRRRYVRALDEATDEGSIAIITTFAEDGPEYCSGLAVARYSAAGLAAEIGAPWQLTASMRQEHHAPSGAVQPFTCATFRRLARS
jgi:SAM-dependent methyltransferase